MGLAAPEPLVLVVDDEATVRQALERALRFEGFAVSTAAGAREAWAPVAEPPPAVVVLDVTMPDLDGVSVVKRMRADGLDVPVCMLSARDEVSDRVAGLPAGADDYLVKPFALDELTARLHALLRRRGSDGGGPRVVGDPVIDARRHGATRGGRSLQPPRRQGGGPLARPPPPGVRAARGLRPPSRPGPLARPAPRPGVGLRLGRGDE